ncbi:hypothetical protein, partial [Agreia sp.]|uniref:hypothetical protein n=1 Tax=Agreia sp. TaxID=1872416 RepID=UPI0035BC6D5B
TFGFWVRLFAPPYDELWRKQLHKVFPYASGKFKRQNVSGPLEDLRNLRNRLAHHEPVHQLDLTQLHGNILQLLSWMDPGLEALVSSHSRVPGLISKKPIVPPNRALVVPARQAWAEYQNHGVYVCQPNRFFRDVNYISFYVDKEIKSDLARVLYKEARVPFTGAEIARRFDLGTEQDRWIANAIKAFQQTARDGAEWMVFILTKPGEEGHRQLSQSIPNTNSGKSSAYVRKQRYVYLHDLESAKTTDDLQEATEGTD